MLSYQGEVEQPPGDLYTKAEALATARSICSRPAREPARDMSKPRYEPSVKHTGTDNKTSTSKTPDTTPAAGEPINPLTDRYAAWLLCQQTKELRWVKPWGWMAWDGARWERDARDLAIKETNGLSKYYQDIGFSLDEEEHKTERKAYLKFARNLDSKIGVDHCLSFAEGYLKTDTDKFDQHHFKLNLANGTLDLKTGKLHPHRRQDRLTQISKVSYDPDAIAPRWEKFLQEIMGGDQVMIDFLQRAIGYALTGDVGEQVLFFCYGTGANGKSIFLGALRDLLGDYTTEGEPNLLMAGDRHLAGIAGLQGKRLITTTEAKSGSRFDETLVKQLTGGDQVSARFMHQNFFEFMPTHKIFLVANHKPIIRGTDHGIWRRVKLIPFEVTIPDDQQDRSLDKQLSAELPGILNWAVAGCQAWLREGLQYPEKVSLATKNYRADSDQLGKFISEACVVGINGSKVKASVVFDAFKEWCEARNERPGTLTSFGNRMTERGFAKDRLSAGVHYLDIELSTDATPAKESVYS
jgi:putative DNA primase/helicase